MSPQRKCKDISNHLPSFFRIRLGNSFSDTIIKLMG